MVKIAKPKTPYVPKYGDIDIYGKQHEYMEAVDWEMFRTMNPMPLTGAFSVNPWNALIQAGIDKIDVGNLKEWSKNYCPCAQMEYHAIVPIALLTSYATRYLGEDTNSKPWYYDMLNDDGWNRWQNWRINDETKNAEMSQHKPEDHMGSVSRAILGSGYNEMILPSDGSHDYIFAAIPLDNDDKIIVIGWEWYNK